MRILIIEDEHFAAKRLTNLIGEHLPEANVLDVLDTVDASKKWLSSHIEPNLIFMDIQLADGMSFQIFEAITINCPIIFTTAYDEYALQAFKFNSVDYLLKPIEEVSFIAAVDKFEQVYGNTTPSFDWTAITRKMIKPQQKFKRRFLIKSGSAYSYLETDNISYIYSEDGLSFAYSKDGKRHNLDRTLDNIESRIDPSQYFRVNRKFIVSLESIVKIHTYFNNRLKLQLKPVPTDDVIVSREKAKNFKDWIDS